MPSHQKGFKGDLEGIGREYTYTRCPECGEVVDLYKRYWICKNIACVNSTMLTPKGTVRFIKHFGRAGLSPSPSQIKAQCRQIRESKLKHGILHKNAVITNLMRRLAG